MEYDEVGISLLVQSIIILEQILFRFLRRPWLLVQPAEPLGVGVLYVGKLLLYGVDVDVYPFPWFFLDVSDGLLLVLQLLTV